MSEDEDVKDESSIVSYLTKLLSFASFSRSSVVNAEGGTIIPKETREHIKVLPKNEVKWYNLPGNFALVRKSVAITFLALLVNAVVLTAFTFPMALAQSGPTPVPAGGPQPVSEEQLNQELEEQGIDRTDVEATTNSTVIEEEPTIDGIPLYPIIQLGESVAHIPIRIQVTYAAGEVLQPPIVERTDPVNSRYSLYVDSGLPEPGRDTLTFQTNSLDNWRVVMGQQYAEPRSQIVTVVAWGNSTEIYRETYPFLNQTRFKVEFRFNTSIEPHIPTPEENVQAIIEPLRELRQGQDALDDSIQYLGAGIISTGGIYQGLILVQLVISAVHGALVLRMWKRDRANEAGLVPIGKNAPPDNGKKRGSFMDHFRSEQK